jgi:glycosyltransferase involved in cell wall biosynthesis
VGGLLDAVEDGVTGLLVPPGDASALRQALARLLGDGRLRMRLGRAAREQIELGHSAAPSARAIAAALHDALVARP